MKNLVLELVSEHKSRDPIEIASNLGITILYEPLGSINGYYNTVFGQQFIHINSDLPDHKKVFTAAHELGHAILHPTSNASFLKNKTYLSVDKMEIEANKFAVHLLISDEDIKDYQELTINQLSMMYGFHEELIKLRFNQI